MIVTTYGSNSVLFFFNAILVLLKLRKWAPATDRVFERRENY
eukprot:COSAG01_NODE_431_length_17124_cov_26.577386_5_plen_42_part_00